MKNFFTKTTEYETYSGRTETTTEIRKGRVIFAAIIVTVLLIFGICSISIVPTGHTGVISTYGKVESYVFDAGFHIKSPFSRVIKMDNRIQKNSLELTCFSSDIQEVKTIYTVNYQISKENAMTIYRTIGKDYFKTVIMPTITETVKVVTAQYTAEKLVGNRSELAAAIENVLAEKLLEFNIILISTAIEDMDFTDAYTNAVEAKQVAQQNKLKAETEAEQAIIEAKAEAEVAREKAQGEADALRIAAEAEAEANKKISESLDENVLKNKWYDQWNGEYPQVISGGGTIIDFPLN